MDDVVRGWVRQHDQPEWRPLLAVVGRELVGWFMWMWEVELADGGRLHAYKHSGTRRYLYVDAAGRAYEEHPVGQFRPRSLPICIIRAFAGWERKRLQTTGDHAALRAAVDLARGATAGRRAARVIAVRPRRLDHDGNYRRRTGPRVDHAVIHAADIDPASLGVLAACVHSVAPDGPRREVAGTRRGLRRRPCPPIAESRGRAGRVGHGPTAPLAARRRVALQSARRPQLSHRTSSGWLRGVVSWNLPPHSGQGTRAITWFSPAVPTT